ncbi:MAG: glycogen synthase [Clostridiales Family XIII bacterium]|jgi:starch synthase|nr:glycogen synthase [Clostridiales Family XIII bacterium]
MKILFAASEAHPFFTCDGSGALAGSLPAVLRRRRADVRAVLPLYGDLSEAWRGRLKHVASFVVPVGWRNQYCGLFELVWQDVTWYFLDNEYYFKRQGLYGFYDDGERFAFFSRAVLETISNIDFDPDVLHCNDWQTALVPVYLNLYFRHLEKFARLKTVFTVLDIKRQCIYDSEILEGTLGIERENAHVLEYGGVVNFTKGAIESADIVSTVSPSYARELLEPDSPHGLEDFLRKKRHKICGILNGIDIGLYNPLADPHIAANYGPDDFKEGKRICKEALCGALGLANDPESPLLGVFAATEDGLRMLRALAEPLLGAGLRIVAAIGAADGEPADFLRALAAREPGKPALCAAPSEAEEHAIYAGCDMLLLPDCADPCAFGQMAALRYGTLPIVRNTGGFRDTVREAAGGFGNGFTFDACEPSAISDACLRAKSAYRDEAAWSDLVRNAMLCDNSWATAASRYMGMYRQAMTLW